MTSVVSVTDRRDIERVSDFSCLCHGQERHREGE